MNRSAKTYFYRLFLVIDSVARHYKDLFVKMAFSQEKGNVISRVICLQGYVKMLLTEQKLTMLAGNWKENQATIKLVTRHSARVSG
ncbi:hypothetical protein AVEN_95613-1 [Araneus ventricosus]|uniref:Uncharacterized protein n=1 Tax=Araneus ventricosus TaxID=182803 RepID=A0A4Y2TBN3_ARAVE|nr:hypothetical protein AVEN_95613-1 [Araneus ventricosus]